MRERYYVYHNKKNVGPYSFAEIETKYNKNELYPTDHVYVAEEGDWKSMLDFILVFGPKMKVVQQTLQTEGSRAPNDTNLDMRRFASGLPAPAWTIPQWKDSTEPVYPEVPPENKTLVVHPMPEPEPQFPPPPAPPRAVMQRRILEQTQRSRAVKDIEPLDFPTTVQPRALLSLPSVRSTAKPTAPKQPAPPKVPALPTKRPPKPTALVRQSPGRLVDASDVAEVTVLPPLATRLQIHILGEARVGDDLEIVVQALSENGNLDSAFDEIVHLGCNQPLQGLEPLRFENGEARIKVRCLTQGQHLFHLALHVDRKQLGESGRTTTMSH